MAMFGDVCASAKYSWDCAEWVWGGKLGNIVSWGFMGETTVGGCECMGTGEARGQDSVLIRSQTTRNCDMFILLQA